VAVCIAHVYSRARWLMQMAVNEELVAKLQSEIAMEEGMKEDEDLSANIKEYLENSPFEVNSCCISVYTWPTCLRRHRLRTRRATRKSS
jgi:hypothetical protein